jgi:CubicO group peptidase (beta-lactamase class C family)
MTHPVPSVGSLLTQITRSHTEWCGAPQVSAAVVDPSGKLLELWGKDANERTVYRIASMTKSFTAALVLLLRDEGLLELDLPISAYAPELGAVVGPGLDPKPITLRDLLSMSSGLATDDPWADRHLDATDDELDEWVQAGLRFAHPTGVVFEYSNLGFALVGRVVHRATGKRLQEMVSAKLLLPLGMTSTVWTEDALPAGSDVAPGWARASNSLVLEPALADGIIAPMGGLWSNCVDLGTWVGFLSSAFGPTSETGPLRPSSRRELQQVHRRYPPRPIAGPDGSVRTLNGGYGLGLNVTGDAPHPTTIWHSGGVPGYGTTMQWRAGSGGVVLLANLTYAPMTTAGALLMDALEANGHWPRPGGQLSPDLLDLGHAFVDLLNNWSDSLANRMFADNVLLDRSAQERRAEFQERLGGAVELVRIEPTSQTAAVLLLTSGSVLHRVAIDLAPIAPARIQMYRWI